MGVERCQDNGGELSRVRRPPKHQLRGVQLEKYEDLALAEGLGARELFWLRVVAVRQRPDQRPSSSPTTPLGVEGPATE